MCGRWSGSMVVWPLPPTLVLLGAVAAAPRPGDTIDQWVDALLAQPAGFADVAALDLPRDFVRRAAGRAIRESFRARYRRLADAAPAIGWPADAVRGLETQAGDHAAAAFVAEHLARLGLLRTTMHLMHTHDRQWVLDGRLDTGRLRAAGIPVELLGSFRLAERPVEDAIVDWYSRAASGGSIEPTAQAAVFTCSVTARPVEGDVLIVPVGGPVPSGSLALIADTEIQRRRALGLTVGQATEMLRAELRVSRVEVVAAPSSRLSVDVGLAADGAVLVADEVAAARAIITAAVEPLSAGGGFTTTERRRLDEAIVAGRWVTAAGLIIDVMDGYRDDDGRLVGEFTAMLPGEPRAAAARLWAAADILLADGLEWRRRRALLPDVRVYADALAERAMWLDELARSLEAAGLRVRRIAALTDETLGPAQLP